VLLEFDVIVAWQLYQQHTAAIWTPLAFFSIYQHIVWLGSLTVAARWDRDANRVCIAAPVGLWVE
jgi:hypothetical protein